MGAGPKDVFVVFSKQRDAESVLALAVKDGLERLGLFAFEYEDWNWLADTTDVPDRARLAGMFDDSKAVLVIAPASEEPSAGVQVELDLLAGKRHPGLVVVEWPDTAAAFTEPLQPAHVFALEGTAGFYLENMGETLAELCWLVCAVDDVARDAPVQAARLLEETAAGSRLLADLCAARSTRPLAAHGTQRADRLEGILQLHAWWNGGTADVTATLAEESGHTIVRAAASTLNGVVGAWCAAAEVADPTLADLPAAVLRSRALTRSRLGDAAALDDITAAAARAAEELERADHIAMRGTLRLAHGEMEGAVTDFNHVLAVASGHPEDARWNALAAAAHHNLGVTLSARGDHGLAADSYTRALEAAPADAPEALMYRCHRAINRYRIGDVDGAIADYDAVIARPGDAPRAEAQARLNRGGLLFERGELERAVQDWDRVVVLADATPTQKLKALINSGDARVQLGERTRAADTYARALRDPRLPRSMRNEVRSKIAALETGATPQ